MDESYIIDILGEKLREVGTSMKKTEEIIILVLNNINNKGINEINLELTKKYGKDEGHIYFTTIKNFFKS